ncbi:tRNA pseudouridine(38-40) synthase TruA [Alkalilimnicola ehrlichii MLHE-1]|uniref:tRNA pseudouridine synthase A n=1 Tax=Alkalilimnicola ehrlichii (strain ATCC BAA-1101 / DSM 17681 / MLHE-1) TaxID=187272 RepID=Q0A9A4_ALKEH|nr:tRNA pseudouridine(38-40) synthase TruA [Alkalilimnicola ehrlichii]ABI56583.1 tRNA pseudouridine synthase A [Alkalilimnicola ehrlichii MLHE-1]
MSYRFALGLEYDGSGFCGWQRQDHAPSVQAALEAALSRVADEPVTVTCAGRTDTGVHATGQVVHFETGAYRPEHAWVLGANANLPDTVSVHWVQPVSEAFHARFGALRRSYRYVWYCSRSRPALLRGRVAWSKYALDPEPMAMAAGHLLGRHDFSAFRAVACQAKHPVRELYRLDVWARGGFVYLDVCANAFLHHMVRNLAGTLALIGRGERPATWAADLLAGGDRTRAGATAPAEGLYLVGVDYPEAFSLPPHGWWPRFA